MKAFPLPNQGQESPGAAVLLWNSRIKPILPSVQERKVLTSFAEPSAEMGVLGGLAATIKLYVLHDESGAQRPVPDLPPNPHLTLSAGNLTH